MFKVFKQSMRLLNETKSQKEINVEMRNFQNEITRLKNFVGRCKAHWKASPADYFF